MKWEADMAYGSFEDLFYNNLSKTGDFHKAYLKTEEMHEQLFNKRRYADINSFRVVMSRKKNKK